jgi:NDP-sugar pyrophosphorylase family protein
MPWLEPRFVLVNGDTYLDVDYGGLLERPARPAVSATMVIYRDADRALDQAGNVDVDADGFLVSYRKAGDGPPLPYLDAGVAVWSRDVLDELAPQRDAFSLEQDVFPALIARRAMGSSISPTRFYDIGTPERLAIFERALPR